MNKSIAILYCTVLISSCSNCSIPETRIDIDTILAQQSEKQTQRGVIALSKVHLANLSEQINIALENNDQPEISKLVKLLRSYMNQNNKENFKWLSDHINLLIKHKNFQNLTRSNQQPETQNLSNTVSDLDKYEKELRQAKENYKNLILSKKTEKEKTIKSQEEKLLRLKQELEETENQYNNTKISYNNVTSKYEKLETEEIFDSEMRSNKKEVENDAFPTSLIVAAKNGEKEDVKSNEPENNQKPDKKAENLDSSCILI